MKFFKLLLTVTFLFAVVACGDDNENANAVNAEDRDEYVADAKSRGIERKAAECMYDLLSEDIGRDFADKFNDPEYDLTSEEQATALKATEECDALNKTSTNENFPEARTAGIQELVDTLGISEKDATCLVDGVVEEYGEGILGTDQTPTAEDQARIMKIADVCEINLAGDTSTTATSTDN